MYVQPWARLSWRAWAAGSAPLRKFEKTAGWVARLERPLWFIRETDAPGLRLEPKKKMSRHSLDATAAYLARSGEAIAGSKDFINWILLAMINNLRQDCVETEIWRCSHCTTYRPQNRTSAPFHVHSQRIFIHFAFPWWPSIQRTYLKRFQKAWTGA